jgi:hypothetical protein
LIATSINSVDDCGFEELNSVLFITSRPERIPENLLREVDLVLAIGQHGESTLSQFLEKTRSGFTSTESANGMPYDAVARRKGDGSVHRLRALPPTKVGLEAKAPPVVVR